MTKVMIVGDSLFMRKHITWLLVQNGYDTVSAEDGEQAVSNYCQDYAGDSTGSPRFLDQTGTA